MEKKLILRGALAGAIAGVLALIFARWLVEPVVAQALSYESGREAAEAALAKAAGGTAGGNGVDLFSRTVQANVGLGIGVVAFGAAMGALFSVVYIVCLGRVGRLGARSLSMLVAGAGFVALYLVPFLKYPANPPSIGNPDTMKQRGGLYLIMVLATVVLLAAAVWLGRRVRSRVGNWNATLLAGAAFVAAVAVTMLALPDLGHLSANVAQFGVHDTETPLPLKNAAGTIVFPGFPADVLFRFRLYSVGVQLIIWTALGLMFAPMAQRLLAPTSTSADRPAGVPTPV